LIVLKQYHPQGEFIPAATAPLHKLFYTKDHLGSVRELVDGNGALQTRYDYDMWGKRVKLSGTLDTDVGYTGHHHHAKSGLVLTWYRAYDAEAGRWLSADPIGEEGGLNLYGYVLGNPINGWDPLGLDVFFNRQTGNAAHEWVKIGGESPRGSSCGRTYGLYPGSGGWWWGRAPATGESPDERHHNDKTIKWVRYPTTAKQEAELEKWVKENYHFNYGGAANPDKNINEPYNVGGADCRRFTKQVRRKLFEILERDGFPKVTSGVTKWVGSE
jgi:RHS repeat-associated protein